VIPWGHFCDGGRRTLAFSSPQPQTPALGQGHPLSPVRCPWAWRLSGVGQELGTRELVSGCPPHQKATVSDLTSRKQPDGPAQAAQQKTVCQPGCQRATTVAFYGIVWPGSAARKPRTQASSSRGVLPPPSLSTSTQTSLPASAFRTALGQSKQRYFIICSTHSLVTSTPNCCCLRPLQRAITGTPR